MGRPAKQCIVQRDTLKIKKRKKGRCVKKEKQFYCVGNNLFGTVEKNKDIHYFRLNRYELKTDVKGSRLRRKTTPVLLTKEEFQHLLATGPMILKNFPRNLEEGEIAESGEEDIIRAAFDQSEPTNVTTIPENAYSYATPLPTYAPI